MVILCMKLCTTAVLVAEAVDEEVKGDNEFAALADEAAVLVEAASLDTTEFKLAFDHQKMPPMTATVRMPETIYMPGPVDVSPFMTLVK